jgi:methionine-rich copper-binding protein CopC
MLRKLIPLWAALPALIATSCAPSFAAPPRLVAAWPVAGASLPVARHTLELTFDRPLRPETTSAAVWRDEGGAPLSTDVSIDSAEARRLRVRLLEPSAGAFQLRWHAVDARSGQWTEGWQDFSLQNESPSPPRIDVSPPMADAGDRLHVVGNGFAQRSKVQLTIGDDEQALGTVQTDARGNLDIEVPVPASVPFGLQPVSAVDGGGRVARASVQVRWGGWPPIVAVDVGQPGPDRGEVTFTLQVRNRSDYLLEHIRVVLQDPSGSVLVGADPAPRREDGTLVWDIPLMDRGVVGPFRATYRTTTALISHAWLDYRHRHARGCSGDECLPAFISESSAESLPVAPAD